MAKRVLIPVPDRDFDITEVSVPWKMLRRAGHDVVFATEAGGARASGDPKLLSGVIFGQLGADAEAKTFYRELEGAPEFLAPIAWSQIAPCDYDALLLPGGHAQGMRQYLGSDMLQGKVAEYFALLRPIAAICHGVLLLARAKDSTTDKSVIAARRTTCLPKYMERTAYFLTAWKLGRYYRTYPEYVEDEVRAALDDDSQFERGPRTLTVRGTESDDRGAFVVEDDNYISARWPGDAYLFAKKLLARL